MFRFSTWTIICIDRNDERDDFEFTTDEPTTTAEAWDAAEAKHPGLDIVGAFGHMDSVDPEQREAFNKMFAGSK